MGFSGKHQADSGLELENKKWVIAGISLRSPLRPIYTKTAAVEKDGENDEFPTTPTAEESRIPARFTCPPAPKKRKAALKCNFSSGVREFFTPPDLESVFIRHIERAN